MAEGDLGGRRAFLKSAGAFGVAAAGASFAASSPSAAFSAGTNAGSISGERLRKIAVEEAFVTKEIAELIRTGITPSSPQILKMLYVNKFRMRSQTVLEELLDIDTGRLAAMDRSGVDMQILSMTAPGVQAFDADTACELAVSANDQLAEAVRRHPTRFGGLACFAPQAPKRAAQEIERAMSKLKLNGLIVNSHTNNEYLDDQKYWPVLEAAEALGAPLYIHPREPSDPMAGPFRDYSLEGAVWGFGMEAGTHAVRLLVSGVFDRFPKLKICLGHMGEGVPFWLWRLNHMNKNLQRSGGAPKTRLSVEEYFKQNFYVTTSGVHDPLALDYAIRKLGPDRILWAIDHPYESIEAATAFIEAAPLDRNVKEKVAYRNAEALFRITPAT